MNNFINFFTRNHTLSGTWSVRETLVNCCGCTELEEIYSFDRDGVLEWRYNETGGPSEYQKFLYKVSGGRLTIIPENSSITIGVDFMFSHGDLALKMENWSDYITLTRVCR